MIYYLFDKSSPPVPVLNQIHPVHTILFYFLKVYFNTLPSTLQSSMCSLSFRFLHQNLLCSSPL